MTKTPKHTQYPFNSFIDLEAYIEKGGDINVVKDGQSWIEYLLQKSTTGNVVNVIKLLSNPELKTEHLSLQNLIFNRFSYLAFYPFKGNTIEETLIKRFDLTYIIKTYPPVPKALNDNQFETNWLHHFLSVYNRFNFFTTAEQYHPQFQACLKNKDQHQNNVWHTLSCYLSSRVIEEQYKTEAFQILDLLNKHFPEGITQKNIFGQTPLQAMTNNYNNLPDPSKLNISIKTLTSYLQQMELNHTLKESSEPGQKLKI